MKLATFLCSERVRNSGQTKAKGNRSVTLGFLSRAPASRNLGLRGNGARWGFTFLYLARPYICFTHIAAAFVERVDFLRPHLTF